MLQTTNISYRSAEYFIPTTPVPHFHCIPFIIPVIVVHEFCRFLQFLLLMFHWWSLFFFIWTTRVKSELFRSPCQEVISQFCFIGRTAGEYDFLRKVQRSWSHDLKKSPLVTFSSLLLNNLTLFLLVLGGLTRKSPPLTASRPINQTIIISLTPPDVFCASVVSVSSTLSLSTTIKQRNTDPPGCSTANHFIDWLLAAVKVTETSSGGCRRRSTLESLLIC